MCRITGVTAPSNWDIIWRQAKLHASVAPLTLSWIGDSYSQGQNASDWATTSFRQLVRRYLLKSYPLYADFYPVTDSAFFINHYNGIAPWVVNNAISTVWAGWYFTPCLYTRAPVAGTLVTFTSPDPCVALDILYASNNSGTFTITIDTNPPIMVFPPAQQVLQKISLTGLANTVHTVVFSAITNANTLILEGITCYTNTTAGIGFSNLCYAGAAAQEWASTTSQPSFPKSVCLSGKRSFDDQVGNFGFPAQPHLAVIALGINDFVQQTSPVDFNWAISDLCAALRFGRPNCSLLVMINSQPNPMHGDVRALVGYQNWYAYAQILQNVATSYNACLVNIDLLWNGHGASLGYQAADNQHPIDAGHSFIATLLSTLL